MIYFFQSESQTLIAVESPIPLASEYLERLCWLFGNARHLEGSALPGTFIGPRKEMVTPWSTNAVEITQNMGIPGISRMEEFRRVEGNDHPFDRMLQAVYHGLDQQLFEIGHLPEPLRLIEDISRYNKEEGLALSSDEIEYLENLACQLGRKLTDSEVFGFSQVNSEHCRHKIFNGLFIIDGEEKAETLFQLIKKTSSANKNRIVSAYTDNVAFIEGPDVLQFAPAVQHAAGYFVLRPVSTVISLKAETHNFPTTVEPFNGAATGSGGEIRDRMAGGKGSIPLAGTAVYMTSYPRLGQGRRWEDTPPRPWLYHNPQEILIKASNGASDFGNKFGQPLINGSLLTFEHQDWGKMYGFDKVIMLAGGIGYANSTDSYKERPRKGDKIIVLGGDNYRIGMGGGAVSSVATGEYANQIELNAVQRSNPEMQKRVYNAIRAMAENETNPIIAIHDHGAGGHLNSLSELVEHTGGTIDIDRLPVGDPTLSGKEIIGNESQERMGLVIRPEDAPYLQQVCERERAPYYEVGQITDDQHLLFEDGRTGERPIDLELGNFFGKPPRTVMQDQRLDAPLNPLVYDPALWQEYLRQVLQLEAVACKDWLTNKVDRSVTGRVAMQQTAGTIQLPVNNLGISTLDYQGKKGVATALGHAPAPGLIDPEAASRLAVAEALTNLVWAPVEKGLEGVSLSANWMWPARQPGEDDRLYRAVKALSDFCIELKINVPTGKDSLSMTQKYPDGSQVISPGTVIVSAVGEVSDVRAAVTPVLKPDPAATLWYLDFSGSGPELGGSSLAQILGQLGDAVPDIADAGLFRRSFEALQELLRENLILAGHDVSAGGLITTLLEMLFPTGDPEGGMRIDLSEIEHNKDIVQLLFSEKPGVVMEIRDREKVSAILAKHQVKALLLGQWTPERNLEIRVKGQSYSLNINEYRDIWYQTSFRMDVQQCGEAHARQRYQNYKQQPLKFRFPAPFTGKKSGYPIFEERTSATPRAAIIREKGVNGDREMAYSLYYAGFEVKDVHMTDLISGRENLEDVQMIVFVGGFSNSDVLGSAKGWAGAFLYNERARVALDAFYQRKDTLSLGICNGCQLMVELGLLYPDHHKMPSMKVNASGKFESQFLNVSIAENHSVMFSSLAGSRLGVWVAHGEGRFRFPLPLEEYHVPAYYSYQEYPGNPNESDGAVAAICSADGRHLAMMPHLERAIFPWQWAHYEHGRQDDELTPWVEAFVNARLWIENHR